MINTIKTLPDGRIKLTRNGEELILKEVSTSLERKTWYTINGKFYAEC
jgi:uncharacterized protein YlzI (FlbEa/FlbD family)